MLAGSPVNCSTMFGFFEDALERWSKLDDSIRNGRPAENCDAWLNRHPGSWERYHANMHGVARLLYPEIVARLKLPGGAKRLVDIGGSHGLYSVEFCRKNPGLSAVIFDWPQAAFAARKTIADHGMSERVSFVEGDFFRDDIGTAYDAAFLFNVLRIFPEQEAVALLSKTQKALRPGGKVFVADQFNSSTPTSFSETNAFLILLELYNGSPGKNYTADQVKSMTLQAGFGKSREILLRRSAGVSVVEAERVS
jgi:cyclopropane fatty-acyl-phospholipid synthase-like methyltransferase